MGFIEIGSNLDDVPEESAVPGDAEYDLSIVNVGEPYQSNSDRTVVKVLLRIDDANFPNAKPVNHVLVFPK